LQVILIEIHQVLLRGNDIERVTAPAQSLAESWLTSVEKPQPFLNYSLWTEFRPYNSARDCVNESLKRKEEV